MSTYTRKYRRPPTNPNMPVDRWDVFKQFEAWTDEVGTDNLTVSFMQSGSRDAVLAICLWSPRPSDPTEERTKVLELAVTGRTMREAFEKMMRKIEERGA